MNIHIDTLGNSIRNILMRCDNNDYTKHNYQQLSKEFEQYIYENYLLDFYILQHLSFVFYETCHHYDGMSKITLEKGVDRIHTLFNKLKEKNNIMSRFDFGCRGVNNAV